MKTIKERTRGKFLKKEIWFSICSEHQEYDEDCHLCNIGNWHNVILYKLDSLLYSISPKLWRKIKNR